MSNFFSYILARTRYIRWDDDDVCFVPDQHDSATTIFLLGGGWDFHCARKYFFCFLMRRKAKIVFPIMWNWNTFFHKNNTLTYNSFYFTWNVKCMALSVSWHWLLSPLFFQPTSCTIIFSKSIIHVPQFLNLYAAVKMATIAICNGKEWVTTNKKRHKLLINYSTFKRCVKDMTNK